MIEEADFGSDAEQDREKIARKTVRWDGEPYTLYCASVGTNGWNLIYIDNGKDIHSPIYQMIILVTCAFATLFDSSSVLGSTFWSVLISIPIAILFLCLQRFYVDGLSGAVKG